MNGNTPILKKPKFEPGHDKERELIQLRPASKSSVQEENGGGGGEIGDEKTTAEEQESALVALIEHRAREVENLGKRIDYYTSQLGEAEQKLEQTKSQLVRLRRGTRPHKTSQENDIRSTVKLESGSTSLMHPKESSSRNQTQSRAQLVIPAVNSEISKPPKSGSSAVNSEISKPPKSGSSAGIRPSIPLSAQTCTSTGSHNVAKNKSEKSGRSLFDVENQEKGTKRKLEQREHKELIPQVCRSSSPHTIYCHANNHISSQHKRKLRSLALCPVNDHLFITSALDGLVNLWQLQGRGSSASLLSTTECSSPKTRRWAEDIAWHPLGNSLVATYTADSGDSQIAIIDLNKTHGKSRVTYLEDKPHVKGIVNGIMFMPWGDCCFVTGGSDHAVVVWKEKDNVSSWKPKALHRNLHSSAVMGIAGMQRKQMVISVGADKRVIGFDVEAGRVELRHQVDSKCMSVLANPCDFNLYMVQTGTPEKQLRLFDIRLRQTEVHTFGFKQESSDSQSALINQGWSNDGWYLSSGSVDPVIHIFDIRYNSHKPSQSIRAHQKRVFKAVWHNSLPLMISISSDLQIGLHKI